MVKVRKRVGIKEKCYKNLVLSPGSHHPVSAVLSRSLGLVSVTSPTLLQFSIYAIWDNDNLGSRFNEM